jgi:hypothetical protein
MQLHPKRGEKSLSFCLYSILPWFHPATLSGGDDQVPCGLRNLNPVVNSSAAEIDFQRSLDDFL